MLHRRKLMKGQVDDVKEWKLIGSIESDGETGAVGLCVAVDLSQYTEVFAIAKMLEGGATRRIMFSQVQQWYNGSAISLTPSTTQTYTLFAKADIIDGMVYAYGGYNSGYGKMTDTVSKGIAPYFSPREDLITENVKYIRYDTNDGGTIPKGEVLKIYAR